MQLEKSRFPRLAQLSDSDRDAEEKLKMYMIMERANMLALGNVNGGLTGNRESMDNVIAIYCFYLFYDLIGF